MVATSTLVGLSIFSPFLGTFFAKITTWEFLGYFQIGKLDAEKFITMKMMFSSANLVLNDAEQQQITNPMVRKWLDDLQEVIYDTQDLMDGIDAKSFIDNVNFNEEIKEILIKLENIVKQKDHLGLKFGVQNTILPTPQTTSLVEESGVYGRDADKETIIKLLLSDEMNGKKISVIPIVGMSGIGKTALAQLIYNENIDDKVMEKSFDFKAWVCVTNEFNIFRITKTVAKRVVTSDLKFEDDNDLDFIQVELKKALINKKFLIVLDDVWLENYSLWSELMKPFCHGENGSKIIVKTQSEKVASMVHDLPPYHLTTLSSDACWNLFKKVAFNNSNPIAPSELEGIGREIVKKCKGLPLAVKSLASLLRHQSNSKDWESILGSDIWELSQKNGNILPALWLSYQYLPSHLKRCFAYCSIFPKGFQFDKEDLIKLWMAEDLLHPQKSKKIEEVGEEYFHDLFSRSLFQKSIKLDKSVCFTMHDLVHDLAGFIVGDFRLRLDDRSLNKPPSKIRYWSYFDVQNSNLKKENDLVQSKHLRTLLLISKKLNLRNLSTSGTFLRVLSLYRCSISELNDDSIRNLKLLRYLNLSRTEIQKIPDAVCTLSNLQTLNLQYCEKLESLPSELNKLTNLRHLNIKGTKIKGMPTRMGTLKDLQTLSSFVLGKDNTGSAIKELQDLQNLSGSLHILGLENVVNAEDFSVPKLTNMKCLTELEFSWDENSDDCSQNHEQVLSGLQPHTNIKALKINDWKGQGFPTWVGDCSYLNIQQIKLLRCNKCCTLPPLGQLPFLKQLEIRKFDRLLKIADDFYCGGSSKAMPFSCLESLQVSHMPECQEWSFVGGDFKNSFPQLKEIFLKACPKLTGQPCLPETIETVEIIGCHKLDLKFPEKQWYESVKRLKISGGCGSMNSICLDYFPRLKKFDLEHCDNLESLVFSEQPCPALHFLRFFKLRHCSKFVWFPQGGLPAPNLEEFDIGYCDILRSLPERMPSLLSSLRRLYIWECPKLESFSESGLPSNLEYLSIFHCNNLFRSGMQWDLQRLACLSTIHISNIDEKLDSFPEEGLLPTTLTQLAIDKFHHLTVLNNKAFHGLTSLEYLTISGCGKLQSLPDGKLPASVSIFDITGSDVLKRRCQKDTGKDWHKVSHIPFIRTNRRPDDLL